MCTGPHLLRNEIAICSDSFLTLVHVKFPIDACLLFYQSHSVPRHIRHTFQFWCFCPSMSPHAFFSMPLSMHPQTVQFGPGFSLKTRLLPVSLQRKQLVVQVLLMCSKSQVGRVLLSFDSEHQKQQQKLYNFLKCDFLTKGHWLTIQKKICVQIYWSSFLYSSRLFKVSWIISYLLLLIVSFSFLHHLVFYRLYWSINLSYGYFSQFSV